MSDETRAKFLSAISERVNADGVAEIYMFQPLKQGGLESGVAVVAVNERVVSLPTGAEGAAENGPDSRSESAENGLSESAENALPASENRLAVYTAKYRLTLKGPERGKWEFAMQAEADAPLVTVEKVVAGVQRRSGDAEEPLRISGEEFRETLRR